MFEICSKLTLKLTEKRQPYISDVSSVESEQVYAGYIHWFYQWILASNLAIIYLLKVNIKNTRKRCEICSMSTIKQQNDGIVLVLVFLLLILNIFHTFF